MNSTQNVARFLHLARIIVDAKHFGIIIADINVLMITFSLKKTPAWLFISYIRLCYLNACSDSQLEHIHEDLRKSLL